MMGLLRDDEDPRALGHAEVFDTYRYVGSRKKGYETWLKAQEEKIEETMKAKAAAEPPALPGKKRRGGADD
jgi:hypothetical protein